MKILMEVEVSNEYCDSCKFYNDDSEINAAWCTLFMDELSGVTCVEPLLQCAKIKGEHFAKIMEERQGSKNT